MNFLYDSTLFVTDIIRRRMSNEEKIGKEKIGAGQRKIEWEKVEVEPEAKESRWEDPQ